MSKRKRYSEIEKSQVISMYNKGYSVSEISEVMGKPLRGIDEQVYRLKGLRRGQKTTPACMLPSKECKAQMVSLQEDINTVAPVLEGFLRLYGDYAITSDWHIPTFSAKWVQRLIDISKTLKINRLIIGGDLFNADIYSIFSVDKPQLTPTMEKELELVEKAFDILETQFKRVDILVGNHDKRLLNRLMNSISAQRLAKLLGRTGNCKYAFSPYPYLTLDGIWRITHPRNYRQTKLSVANDLSAKFSCNVMMAHGHFCTIGYSRGGYQICDSGGMFDGRRVDYRQFSDTTHPQWNNGFFIYQNKIMKPFMDGYTDWNEYNTK